MASQEAVDAPHTPVRNDCVTADNCSGGSGMEPVIHVLRLLCRYLNENELFYVFTGELALKMLGLAEEVQSLEVLMNVTPEQRSRLMNYLAQEGFDIEARWRGPVELRHKATGIAVRLRTARTASETGSIARRVPLTLGYSSFFIPSTEDLLLTLLEGSPRSATASELYIKWRNFLDMEYLISSARSRGLYERFIELRKRAET